MAAVSADRDEVWIVEAEVAGDIGVFDGEAEAAGEFAEGASVGRVVEPAREGVLEFVVAAFEVEDGALRLVEGPSLREISCSVRVSGVYIGVHRRQHRLRDALVL